MAAEKPKSVNEKKPMTEIKRKRLERKAKKLLPRPPRPAPTSKSTVPKEPKIVRPKPKPQNPGYQKWMALFKRELIMIETHIKRSERFRQHWRAEIDKMEDKEEKRKWETGELGNYVRLLKMMDRSREIYLQAREMSSWIVPKKYLSLNKNGMGMKKFILGASSEEKPNLEATDGKTGVDSDDEDDFMDTDEDETGDAPPADYIPLNIVKKAPKTSECAAEKGEDKPAAEPVEPNSFFVVDTKPTPVNLNGTSKKSRKRAKEEDSGEQKSAKKAKREKAVAAKPKPATDSEQTSASNSNPSRVDDTVAQPKVKPGDAPKDKPKSFKVDFSSIEAKLQADIEAGTKAKEERQKLQAEMKLVRKDKKRKRLSEGSSENDMKKPKQQDPEKEVEKNEDDVTNIEKPDKEAIPFSEKDVDTVDKDLIEVEKKVSKGKPKNNESNFDEHGEKTEKTGAENLAKTAKEKKKESKKRKAENGGDEGVLTDEGGKKKSKVTG